MNRAHNGRRVFAAGAIFLGCCSAVFALNPSIDISQYAHKSWKVSEGFFNGPINTIAQTPDGYLWIGTELGLYRFDGLRSVPWQPRRTESLPSNIIRKLFVSRDGILWIGTQKGLASWKDGRLTLYPELPAEGVDAIAEDNEGTIWAGLEDIPAWRLCSIKEGAVQCFGKKGTLGLGKGSLLSDRKGNLWAGTGTGLWLWKPGSPKSISLSGPISETHAIAEDDHGDVLVSTRGGIIKVFDGNAAAYPLPNYGEQFNPFALLRDSDGGLWIGTKDQGLLHVHQGRTDHFGKSKGISSDSVADLFEDREGNIWVGTASGLDQFREFAVSTMSDSLGFSAASVESVLTAGDGSVWLGTRNGLDRWQEGRLTLYRKSRARLSSTVRQIIDPGLPDDFQSTLYEDHRGRIWIFSRAGAAYLNERGRFIRIPGLPGGYAHSVAEDSAGDLWISQDQDFFHLLQGGKVEQIPWTKLGGRGLAFSLAGDPSSGGLWLGFSQGGVAYFKDGQIRKWYTSAEGLGEGRVNKLQIDRDGTLWAGTEGGLSRLKRGRIDTLNSQNGLPCNSVHEFVLDNAQSIWLHTGCGLVRIPHSDLEMWLRDPKRTIKVTVFDSSDGLTPVAIPGGLSPRMGKSVDGKMWFLTSEGVGVIDPQHLPFNQTAPLIHIEQITADGKTYDASNGLHLPSLVRDLAINYTALSFVAPEKVRFRYRLEGQDKDWRVVINDRHVQYSNLAPGNYRFRVVACNNSGIWNEEGASLDFVIPPAWFQTNWFRAVGAAVLLALIWVAYRLRIREVEEREKKFREAVESMPALAFIASSENERAFVNKGWIEYTGLTGEQASGSGWQAAIHPDDLKRVLDKWRNAMSTGQPFDYDVRLHRADGEYRWFHTRNVPVRNKRGRIVKWCGVTTDIEDRKRAEEASGRLNRELRAISNCNQALLRATDEQTLLETICRTVCEEAGYRMAFVAYAEHDEAKSVRPVAWTGAEAGYLATVGLTWADTERGRGPTGTAIRSGESCCIQDFASDPRLDPWRESVLQRGFRSGIGLPLKDEHANTFGSLTIHSAQPNAFTPEETRLLEELAADLAFGIVTLRSRAAREQAEQEVALLSFALNNVGEAALLIDDTARFHSVNDEACRVLGYTRAELLQMGVPDIDPEFPAGRWSDHWRDLKAQRSLSFESCHRTRDGRAFPVEISANYFEYEGRPYNLALVRDITERKRAEETLRRSGTYLAEAQKLSHTGSWVSDGKSRETLFWSEEMFRIFGFDPNEGLPKKDQSWQRIHLEDRARVKEASDRTFREKIDYDVQYRIVLPDGTVKHIHSIGHPVLNADGDIVEVIGTNVDITERKRAEEALRESETRFRTFVDHTADAFFMLDFEDGTIIDVNQPACESLGYSREDLIGKTPLAFDVDLDRGTFESIAHRAAAGETVLFDKHRHRRKDGSTFPVEVHTSVFHHGGRRFLLKVARDITDRVRAEEEHNKLRQLEADLAHMNRVSMLGELTASIAHEVNQPLSGVVSNGSACLRWLAGDTPNFEEAREAARRIVRDGKRAGDVIARVRALTRKTEALREMLDINETIREVLAIVSDEAKRNNVMIQTQFADDIVSVCGDRVQVQQVLINLMLNGIEAMKDTGGVLTVKSRPEHEHVAVSVSDTGVGLPAEKAERIFDAFFTTKPQGTGMGLTISRSIIESHGGRIWVTANGGHGTIFHFTLPAAARKADVSSNIT